MNCKTLLALLFLVNSLILSCKGPEGDPGPTGPAGPTGSTGVQGEKGETGNANVHAYTFRKQKLTQDISLELSVPAITTEILENGLILGYFRVNAMWYTLPYYYSSAYHIDVARITEGKYFIKPSYNLADIDIRIVIAPATSNTEMRVSGIDFSDYTKVKEYYGLKD
jgi:hypothetical protein